MPRAVVVLALALVALAPAAAAQYEPALGAVLTIETPDDAYFTPDGEPVGARAKTTYCHHPAGAAVTSPTVVHLDAAAALKRPWNVAVTPATLEFGPALRPGSAHNCLEPQWVDILVAGANPLGDAGVLISGEAQPNWPIANVSAKAALRIAAADTKDPRYPIPDGTPSPDAYVRAALDGGTSVSVWTVLAPLAAVGAVAWRVRSRAR